MDNKKKKLMTISLSLFAIAIVSFGTYALWNSELLTGNNSISSGQVKMSYTESNEIGMDNALPIKDAEGKILTNYFDFQVLSYIKTRANDDTERKINYKVVLEPITVDNPLSDSEIKVYLTKVESGKETVVVQPTTIDQLSNYVLNSQDEVFSNDKAEVVTSYRLRAWIDEKVDTNKLNEKSYSYRFRVNINSGNITSSKPVSLDVSGANAPELTSNMIPVYYDSTSDSWKKADSNNVKEANKWYDYDNKMWANAVTVTNTNRETYLNADAGTTIPMSDINTMWVWVPRYTYTMLNTCANIKNPTESANPKCYEYVYKDKYHDDLVNDLVGNGWVSNETEAEEVVTAWKNGETANYITMTFNEYVEEHSKLTFDKTFISTNVSAQSFNIKFEKGTQSSGTIKCTDAVTGTSSTSETCTDTTNGGLKVGTSTYTHPAFWWDKNDNSIREEGEELTGIWVGKFEVSSDTSCTPSNNVAVGEGCNLQTIRPRVLPNVTSWTGAQVGTFFNGIQKMRESGNKYGFTTADETHMMKNMEWGAVAYLSHSKYGINKEVAINSANTYTTGCGPQSAGSTSSGTTCNSYTTALGQSASTTGNVYGVYDMSGGAFEYMMSNMVYSNGQQTSGYGTYNNQNSAFTGILDGDDTSFTGTYAFPSKRYYDKYSYGEDNREYTRGKLGDATKEMAPVPPRNTLWYSDRANFVYSSGPWVLRGGYYDDGVEAGAFEFNSDSSGDANTDFSTRAVISNLN